MNSYILRFFSYHQPRRIRVIEGLLTNRQTVSNLFWGQQYGLLQWLGANRQLQRAEYDATIKSLVEEQLLIVDDEHQARLTVKGVQQQEAGKQYQPHFLDWYWITNTNQFGQRLLLGMQVVSEYAYHNAKYAPVTVEYGQMLAVKQWFRRTDRQHLAAAVYRDLDRLTTGLADANPKLAAFLVDGLVGHDLPAWTNDQLAEQLHLSTADMLVLNHDLLLGVAAYCRHVPGPLHDLLAPLLNAGPLSRSAGATLGFYRRGATLEQIAARRHLKLSTVREHILEAAILCPDQLDWDQLLPAAQRAALAKRYPTEDVTAWRFQPAKPAAGDAFFEYRLFQIFQGRERHD